MTDKRGLSVLTCRVYASRNLGGHWAVFAQMGKGESIHLLTVSPHKFTDDQQNILAHDIADSLNAQRGFTPLADLKDG